MKKIILSAASLAVAAVASVSVAPTTSEAIPAFARQTGSACLACHFQSFPTLSAYGRAFKMGGMTDSAVDMVEDEHLSIPLSLNWTAMVRPTFAQNKVTPNGGTAVTTNTFEFADQVFMIGGHGGAHTGVFLEVGFSDTVDPGGYANAQMINSWDMGDMKAGVTIWQAGFGEDAGMQVMSVWGQHGGMLGGKRLSINNSMGTDDSAGVAAWAGSDAWVAQLAMVNIVDPGASLAYSPVLRGNYFLEAGDWEVGLGAIVATGTAGAAGNVDTSRTGIDVQAFGEVSDMQIGVFFDWATAAAGDAAGNSNFYNASTTDDRTGYSFRVSVKPTHNLIFLAGIGQDKTGNAKVDKTQVGVEWEAYQNFAAQIIYEGNKDETGATDNSIILDLELLV